MTRFTLAALLCLSACADAGASEAGSAPVLLDRHPELLLEPELPDSSREPVGEQIPVISPWRAVSTTGGVRTWETPLPVRLRSLFFGSPPDDLAVFGGAEGKKKLRHAGSGRASATPETWEFGPGSLRVRRPVRLGPPEPGEIRVSYSRAVERERSINYATSKMSAEDFIFRSVQVDDTTRHGLLLPAPARAPFSVLVPTGGMLSLDATLLPPEAADVPPSDGAVLRVLVQRGDEAEVELTRVRLEGARDERALRVSLADYAGERIRLSFVTEPGAGATGDYVFLAEPTVYAPQADPPRVVLIFVDTLRRDHLSVYGYTRPTTPNLEALARDAAVFEQARSVAPWTLPSTRTMVTGVVPERWKEVDSLPRRFAEAGWATAFMAGNIYLSSNFEIDRDWGTHRCINWPRADVEIDRALAFLEENHDRPAFVLVHLMDQHLPYKEGLRWRYRFAGERPAVFPSDAFSRTDVTKLGGRIREEERQFLRDRYDNNLAYVDDQLTRLFDALDLKERDTVMLIADHGEEFWDHGGFEHGHALYDELLRIPAILLGPGVAAGRYEEPVSMLDVAPTLAEAAGLSLEGMEGWPLQRLADRSRAADFAARPQAFGRPLYGEQLWGGLSAGQKLIIDEGEERLFEVLKDPLEDHAATPAPDQSAAMRAAMSAALGVDVVVAWRLQPVGTTLSRALHAELEVPGGVTHAWVADDPTMKSAATVRVEGQRVSMDWEAGGSRIREIFVVPAGDPAEALATATLSAEDGRGEMRVAEPRWAPGEAPPAPDGKGDTLLSVRTGSTTLNLNYMSTPLPPPDQEGLRGFDPEVAGELKALGYVEDDAKDEDQP